MKESGKESAPEKIAGEIYFFKYCRHRPMDFIDENSLEVLYSRARTRTFVFFYSKMRACLPEINGNYDECVQSE